MIPGLAGELLNFGARLFRTQVPACKRTHEVGTPSFATALECIGVRHLVFLEVVGELVHRDVHTAVGYKPALVHRVLRGMPQRHEFVVVFQRRELEFRCPLNEVATEILNALKLLRQFGELRPGRGTIETPRGVR